MFKPKESLKIARLLMKAQDRLTYLSRKSPIFFNFYKDLGTRIGESFDWSNRRYEPYYTQTHIFISTRDTLLIDEQYLIFETGYDPNKETRK